MRGLLILFLLLATDYHSALSSQALENTREVIVNNDGFSSFFGGGFQNAGNFTDYILNFKSTTVTGIEWCVNPIGSVLNIPSTNAELLGNGVSENEWAKLRRGDRIAADTILKINQKGIDPLQLISDLGRAHNIKIYAAFRMDRFYPPPFAALNGAFWKKNQDKRIQTRNGKPLMNLSYAFPEVQNFYLSIITDAMERNVAGLSLDFLRRPPFFGYESILTAAYKEQYHADSPGEAKLSNSTFTNASLSDYPPEQVNWWKFRSHYMTQFLRNVKQRSQAFERIWGHPIKVSVRIDHRFYLPQGLDIDTWIKEGLIDILIVSQLSHGGYNIDLKPFRDMVAGTDCVLLVGEEAVVMGHDLTPEEDRKLMKGEKILQETRFMAIDEYAHRALRWYDNGADGLHIFNGGHQKDVLKIIGDIQKIKLFLNLDEKNRIRLKIKP